MKSFRAIKNYVNDCFLQYDIEPRLHFYDHDEYEMPVEMPIFKDNSADMETATKLGEILGLDAQDILNADRKAMKKIYNKYAYFRLMKDWDISMSLSLYKDGHQMDAFLLAIFDGEDKYQRPWKFDTKKTKERLILELKKASKYMPELYHEGATIENFSFSTETFANFPNIEEYIQAYFEVMDRLEYLFFATFERDLTKEEINEYNLFVSHFVIYDIFGHNYLHYSLLVEKREMYKAEGYSELFSYIRMQRTIQPWRCKEFVLDRELVEKFLNRFPDSKFEMRKFLHRLLAFDCSYNWSDSIKPIIDIKNDDIFDINPEEDKAISEALQNHYKNYLLKKTDEELGSDLIAAKTLQTLLSAPSLGGIKIRYSKEYDVWFKRASGRTPAEFNSQKEMQKMIKRMEQRKKIIGGGD